MLQLAVVVATSEQYPKVFPFRFTRNSRS